MVYRDSVEFRAGVTREGLRVKGWVKVTGVF